MKIEECTGSYEECANEKLILRMRDALLMIEGNLRGNGMDFRPLEYAFAVKIADFANKIAHGEPVPEFDQSRT